MNFANITLGELLSSNDATIKRNALSILKQLQKERDQTQLVALIAARQREKHNPLSPLR